MHTALEPPRGVWWKPAHGTEKVWVALAFGWCMILFAMMPLWHWKGGQNPSGIRSRVEPAAFQARTEEFIETYEVGEENGFPIVEPPPGSDIYLLGRMWAWTPILKLRKDVEYTLHLSSIDVNHGFALFPINVNFQVVPGYDYGLRITPSEAGEFQIVCNEFCGIGHHRMVGKVIVVDDAAGGGAGGSPAVSTGLSARTPRGTRTAADVGGTEAPGATGAGNAEVGS